jgi:membrane protein required for colicin V production
MGLTALDIIVLLFVGGGLVLGYLRGFVAEVMSLVAWVVAIITIKLLHTPVSNLLTGMVGTSGGAAVLAFTVIFLPLLAPPSWWPCALGNSPARRSSGRSIVSWVQVLARSRALSA